MVQDSNMYCKGNTVGTVFIVLRDKNLISGRFMCNSTILVSDF